jgi:hypothetical protein
MDSIDDSEITLGLILESRKQRLQELKEEMKDILFGEFILKQGDFMNVDVERKGTSRRQPNTFTLGINYLFFSKEDDEELKNCINESAIKCNYTNEINRIKFNSRHTPPKLGYGPNGINNDVLELEKACAKELLELKDNPLNSNKFWDRKIQEEIEYQKLEKEMITNNEIFIHFGSNIEEAKKEFEKKFWNYISQNGGFKNGCCSKCGKVPTIDRESVYFQQIDKPVVHYIQGVLEYREIFEDFIENKTWSKQTKVIRSGKIKYIHCCKFLYDFEEKKMYKVGSPGKKYTYGQTIPMLQKTNEFILCEEYDFKTKKDLYEEMETMKASFEARLLKLENLLNL